MRTIFCALSTVAALAAQTAVFPSGVVTDQQLKTARNRALSTLSASITASATFLTVADGSQFRPNMLITIDNEILAICEVVGNTLTAGHSGCPNTDGRGFDGTSAAAHTDGAYVYGYITAWHHIALAKEVEAIETALGAGLGNVAHVIPIPVAEGGTNATTAAGARANLGAAASGTNNDITSLTALSTPLSASQGGSGLVSPMGLLIGTGATSYSTLDCLVQGGVLRRVRNVATKQYECVAPPELATTDYDFPRQAPAENLSPVLLTVSLTPCPLGVAGTYTTQRLAIYNTAGVWQENGTVSGGSCTSGATTGTIIFSSLAGSYSSGNYRIGSATAGIQEAINARLDAGHPSDIVIPAGNYSIYAPVTFPLPFPAYQGYGGNFRVRGSGRYDTVLTAGASFPTGATGMFVGTTGEGGPEISDLTIQFPQPDSTDLAGYSHWTAFYFVGMGRFHLHDVTVIAAWDTLNMTGNAGGSVIENLWTSAFDAGILADGSFDTVRLDGYHFWPFGLTTNQRSAFTSSSNTIYGFNVGRIDGFFVTNSMIYGTRCGRLYRGSAAPPWAHFSNLDCDTTHGLFIDSGTVYMTNSYFSAVGGPAIQMTTGSVKISNSHFYGSDTPGTPLINVPWASDATYNWSTSLLQVSDSSFYTGNQDKYTIYAVGSGANGGGVLMLNGSFFLRNSGGAYTVPTIHVATGTGQTVRLHMGGNRIMENTGGSGAWVSIANDDYHQIARSNFWAGWSATFPASKVYGSYNGPGISSNANNVTYDKLLSGSACASGASPAVCGASWVGSVALAAGGTTLTVNTTAITANSQVLLTENTTVGGALAVTCNTTAGRTYAVTAITAGTSFTVTASAAPVTNPACLQFYVIN